MLAKNEADEKYKEQKALFLTEYISTTIIVIILGIFVYKMISKRRNN